MASVDTSLACRPEMQAKIEIGRCFFGERFQAKSLTTFGAYFRYYDSEIDMLRFGSSPLSWQSTELAAKTHGDILYIAAILLQSGTRTRPAIRSIMKTRFQGVTDIALNRSIDLTMRLWLSLNIREEAFRPLSPQTPALEWDDASSMQDFLSSLFPPSHWQIDMREGRLHPYFTVANMVKICRLKIEWTDSLEDHLRLDRRQKVLRVFPHKCCLTAHLARTTNGSLVTSM